MGKSTKKQESQRDIYLAQNRAIHAARSQLGMDLDDCRALAMEMSGEASLSRLNLKQRFWLIEELKRQGADIFNPALSEKQIRAEDLYPQYLEYWQKKFPRHRPGYATNEQLAWIESLWRAYFDDGRAGSPERGLRGFLMRQTQGLEEGPVSDLAFLRSHHVRAAIGPLKAKARDKSKKE